MKLDEIKELARIFGKSKLDKMKIKMKEFELEMEKGSAIPPPTPAPTPVAAPAPEPKNPPTSAPVTSETSNRINGDTITSPMVGTFYASPSPDSPPFVKVGDMVKKGQPLCILEAMKIMNELEAEYDCKIVEVLVADGEAVEYAKPLFVIEKI